MPASKRTAATERATGATFVITRTFAAPLAQVWKAWSEAAELKAWWGPKGCTMEVATLEFRPGGFFHYAMRFANGTQWWGRFLYRTIVAGERIQWLNSFSNAGCGIARAPFDAAIPLEVLNDVTFTERGGRTTVTLRAAPHGATAEETAAFKAMHSSLETGYGGTFDQLAEVLTEASTGQERGEGVVSSASGGLRS